MPALPPVPHVVRVVLVGTLGEDTDVINRFYMGEIFGTSVPANLNAVCLAIANAWNSDLASLFASDYTLSAVEAEDLTSATAPVGAQVVAHTGTRSGAIISASASAIVQHKIARRYRGGHPRTYLSCFTQTDLHDAQTWLPASTAALVSGWTTFIAACGATIDSAYGNTGSTQANVSFYEGFENITYPSGRTYPRPKLRTTPLVDDILSHTVNPHVGSQRRRNQTP